MTRVSHLSSLIISARQPQRNCATHGNCEVPGHGLSSSPGKQSRAIRAFAILAHQVDGLFDGWHLSSFYCPPNDVIELAVSLMPRRTAAAGKTMYRPRSSTALSHGHLCGSHALQPSLCVTATLMASSDSLSPTDVMGDAGNQSPECGLIIIINRH